MRVDCSPTALRDVVTAAQNAIEICSCFPLFCSPAAHLITEMQILRLLCLLACAWALPQPPFVKTATTATDVVSVDFPTDVTKEPFMELRIYSKV